MSLILLNANILKKVLPMQDAITAMKTAFKQLANGKVEMPLRTGVNIPKHDAVMMSMPAYLPDVEQLGIKIVTLFPHNFAANIPSIHGIVILFNAKNGQPEVLLDGAMLTAIRTGAVSGLATDLLARPDAASVAIIGSGIQAKTQLEAVCCVRKIKQIWIYSRTRKNAERFLDIVNAMDINAMVQVADSAQQAVKDADIVCTATPATSPILDIKDIKPGTHINAVGSHTAKMCELSAELVAQSIVVVDQCSAALAEAGEIIQAIQKNLFDENRLIELGKLIINPERGRKAVDQITIFKSVGLAVQDISAAEQAFKNALKTDQGIVVEL